MVLPEPGEHGLGVVFRRVAHQLRLQLPVLRAALPAQRYRQQAGRAGRRAQGRPGAGAGAVSRPEVRVACRAVRVPGGRSRPRERPDGSGASRGNGFGIIAVTETEGRRRRRPVRPGRVGEPLPG
ncbi:hypothetical protein GCM10010282_54480 [Streptomyces roseolus]|nr:hypothetical protein GCM10010282_54480 [Streptomyces roseolus]